MGQRDERDEATWSAEGDTCVALLREIVRIPTVNRGTREEGDGNERPVAERLAEHLRSHGLEPKLFEKQKTRTSVVTRLRGDGSKPPLLLNAHLDVVEADATRWQHDPFGAEIHDGYVWGRGTLDMKHMAAMSACVMGLLARDVKHGKKLTRDVIFAGVADEEAACGLGSMFLVEDHPDEVRAEHMLGEVGAFSLNLLGRTFYPIQVAEKGACSVRATYTGHSGHGSLPDPDGAVMQLAEGIARLGRGRLPMHPIEVVETFLHGMARELPVIQGQVLRRLTTPQIAGLVLDYLVTDSQQKRSFGAMLSNTASPTIVRAGSSVNVHPGEATVTLDGRTLPGQTDEGFLAELREAMGGAPKLEILRSLPPVDRPTERALFDHLAATLRRHDPTSYPLPYLVPGLTDAKAYSRLGTACYGFAPLKFDPTHEVYFAKMYHGHDERVPIAGVKWGLRVLYDAVSGFCGGAA